MRTYLSIYALQELMFCETCDSVFCSTCTGGSHRPGGTGEAEDPRETNSSIDHTVIPFSIAIKRMSEIMIYKAKDCTEKVINFAFWLHTFYGFKKYDLALVSRPN